MVTAGYKQSEVGVIPEDWEALPARDIGVFKGGSGFPLTAQGHASGEYPFFKVSDMNNEGNETFMVAANHYISEQTRKRLGATAFPTDSIVFAKVGAAVFLERKKILGQPSCIDNNMAAFVLDTTRADVRFVHSLLLSTKLGALVATTALPALNNKQLGELVLAIPPLPEQCAISAALIDVDALLDGLDRLITKKRDLRAGAMQRLLTGETRLPGFTDPWQEKRVGELGRFLKGSGVPRGEALSGEIPCIRYGEIYTTHHNVVQEFTSRISRAVAKNATRIQFRDLLFAASGETKEEIGKCVALTTDVEAYAGGDIIILRPDDGNPVFLGYLMNIPQVARQKANRGQGDAVVHISAKALAAIEILLPDEREQEAIAEVLSDMDSEITALEERLAKTRDIKQAMMQALLTGRVRLPVSAVETCEPEAAHA